ncbi:MAG: preprotein translocase subunit SecA [Flavobacteriales bacterium TMED84]|nr:MAG: preprotein translocase subunit SecA [Flavobacteriales bacterium TMED84]|tara:strand:- start:11325 stop:14636 length:3312 start_codon:yes stop_codon:yes gene_type:complete
MSGVLNFLTKIFGNKYDSDINKLKPIIENINAEVKNLSSISNDELRDTTRKLKLEIKENTLELNKKIDNLKKSIDDTKNENEAENIFKEIDDIEKQIVKKNEKKLKEILPRAFAVVKETAIRFKNNKEIIVNATEFDLKLSQKKDLVKINGDKAVYNNSWKAAGNWITWDMVHYDVQLIGGIVLHEGKIAEMQTGEGKTLSATLPIYLNALTGLGVHLVTVNNYLAKRDAEWMGPIFEFHGLSVDCIDNHSPNSEMRQKAYLADITYGTNNEFGFDYLRDNMSRRVEDLVQRKLNFSIVDEVDSVLIDDARTPLIISGPTPKGDQHEYNELKHKVNSLFSEQKKYVSQILFEAKQFIKDKERDKGGFNLLRAFRGLPKNKALIKFLSEEGVRALLQKTENFYMQDQSKEMHKVDEDLFFTIDEKNNSIELTEKGINLITKFTDDKHFFIMPDVGEEISKIQALKLDEKEEIKRKDELMRDFSVKSERIHSINQLLKAYTLFEKDTEYVVIDNKVKIVDEQTGRIMEGRRYSDGLHQAIEAKENVKIESASQTYATVTLQNYFRMYNKLSGMTGTAETEAGEFWEIYKLDVVVIPTNKPIQRQDKNDLVYKTNREKYNAIIEEIEKLSKAGRPILVGTTSVEISELLSKILTRRKIKHNVLNAKLHQKEADIVAEAGKESIVTIATNMAGRGTDIKLSDNVKNNGGLAIIGTERHDSRRVDRQLRGRSGRQGDPGSSQFYVSLEDNLMRLFGSERIAKIMDRMGLEEGEVIQHSMVNKSIERAQKKVEENNFGIRKRLLEYDDVMNQQREVIYKKRKYALFGDRLSVEISNMFFDTCDSIVSAHFDSKDFSNFELNLMKFLSIQAPIDEESFKNIEKIELTDLVYKSCYQNYKLKSEIIAQSTFPVIENVFRSHSGHYKNIVIPFSDGVKTMNVVTNLEEAYESKGKNIQFSIEKSITLSIIDDIWKEHLREMDDLKQSVQNAVYEQKDPLLIYKFESFDLFKTMLDKVNKEIISFLIKSNLPNQSNVQQEQIHKQQNLQTSRPELAAPNKVNTPNTVPKTQPIRVEQKVGRNEKVKITNGSETKELKWKKAKPLVDSGQWQRV